VAQTVKTKTYVDTMKALGYSFRLNDCNDTIEINGERMNEIKLKVIRAKMRERGYAGSQAIEDALTYDADKNHYHPIKEYLAGLTWDGKDHIAQLATHFPSKHGLFRIWLRKWLIGAVAKAATGVQNYMLVLDGKQGMGKSNFVQWLGSPLPTYFVEGPIDPDNKDCRVRLMAAWIWEVAELGATVRRADVEALKSFISREWVTERHPYGHYDIYKPAMASFVGTVNNDRGFLSDKTGERRFVVTHLTDINWDYSKDVNIHDVWAEANMAFINGEEHNLTPDERVLANAICEDYKIPDTVGMFLEKCFVLNAANINDWTATSDIIVRIQNAGFQGNSTQISMGVASTLLAMGIEKKRKEITNFDGSKSYRWGYIGVREIGPNP